MEIIKLSDGINVTKAEGTRVVYHIFPEYEIHYNEVPPGTIQQWHHHERIEEVLFITSGSLIAKWMVEDDVHQQVVNKGDLVRVENTPHTFENTSDVLATFLVIRLVLDGKDNREIIKNDKHLDD